MNTRTKLFLALVWLAPLAFAPFRDFSMEHDTVNFALAIGNFDIALHQPQPPGFPYWVLALKAVCLLGVGPIMAQTLLAFLFTLAAAVLWRLLDPEAAEGGVWLILFSPVAWFYSAVPATNSLSLTFSCAFLIFAVQAWNGSACAAVYAAAVLGVWSGFRSAEPTFLLPLLVICAWRAKSLWRPVLTFAALWLSWYGPVVVMTGGYSVFAGYMSALTRPTFAQSSVFFGAPLRAHLQSDFRVCISLFLMLAPLGIAAVLADRRTPCRRILDGSFWPFALLFAGPTLLFVTMVYGSKPGYLVLLLPLASLAVVNHVRLNRRALLIAVAASVSLSFFPYEWLLRPETAYQFTRGTLRSLFLIEEAQRSIAALGPSGPASILTNRREAPNLRTVRYHFPSAQWTSEPGGCTVVANPWRPVDGARIVSSNAVYALWRRECPPTASGK